MSRTPNLEKLAPRAEIEKAITDAVNGVVGVGPAAADVSNYHHKLPEHSLATVGPIEIKNGNRSVEFRAKFFLDQPQAVDPNVEANAKLQAHVKGSSLSAIRERYLEQQGAGAVVPQAQSRGDILNGLSRIVKEVSPLVGIAPEQGAAAFEQNRREDNGPTGNLAVQGRSEMQGLGVNLAGAAKLAGIENAPGVTVSPRDGGAIVSVDISLESLKKLS